MYEEEEEEEAGSYIIIMIIWSYKDWIYISLSMSSPE